MVTEPLECREPLLEWHELRVGDGIRCAGQQVSQANLRPDPAGKHPQGQVKRARYIPQQRREQNLKILALPVHTSIFLVSHNSK